MRINIIISMLLSLGYAYNTDLSESIETGNDSDCLTDELHDTFTDEEYNNLVKRRKFVREKMRNKLFRTEIDTLFIPVVFHNYYEIIDGAPSRSFCDYESGDNETGVYTNNNDPLICIERAEKALEILNQQFLSAQIKFIPPTDTSLVVEDIKENGTLFIYNHNWSEIRNNNNIDNVLNIYVDYCIGRINNETEDLECGTVGGWTIYPELISSTSPPGLAVKHSAFPGINDNPTGIIAHEIGHMFTLRHLYHLPVLKNDEDKYEIVSDFQRELVSGGECNSRGDMICDTPGQPLQDLESAFDRDNCIYHGFGGEYDTLTNTLKIGGFDKTGTYRDDFADSTNFISHSNFDDIGDFWGTQGIPDSCFYSNQEEYSAECIDTLYKFLPIAANFLQLSGVRNACLNEQDIGFTPEQLANMRYSIELDYTGCTIEDACNTGSTTQLNIPPSDLFLHGHCYYGSNSSSDANDCLTAGYDCVYDCDGNLSLHGKRIPENFTIDHIYPNPFNPITTIRYGLSQNTVVQITVHDITGRLITSLVNEFQTAGYNSITWDASSFSSGIYILNMSSEKFTKTQKLVLIK